MRKIFTGNEEIKIPRVLYIWFFQSFKNENQRCFIFPQKTKSPTDKKIKGSNINLQEKKVKSIHEEILIVAIHERHEN